MNVHVQYRLDGIRGQGINEAFIYLQWSQEIIYRWNKEKLLSINH